MEDVKNVLSIVKTENIEQNTAQDSSDLNSPASANVAPPVKEEPKDSMLDATQELYAENNPNEATNENPDDKLDGDVPEDFFDDFNNKDFLAGLDVVDAWEDDELTVKNKEDIEKETTEVVAGNKNNESDKEASNTSDQPEIYQGKSSLSDKSQSPTEEEAVEKSAEQEIVDSTSKVTGKNSDKSEKTEAERTVRNDDIVKTIKYTIPKKRRSRSRDKEKEIGRVLPTGKYYPDENRRDPDKVRRDIQRDKAKCEKQRVTDKLRMVETGLVPPGTEMDQPDARDVRPTYEKGEELQGRCSNQGPRSRPAKRPFSRSPSPIRRKKRYSRSRSPLLVATTRWRHSPGYRRRTRSRSPVKRTRSRTRSPLRRMRNRSRTSSPPRRYHSKDSSKHRDRDRSQERKTSFLDELERKLSRADLSHMQKLTAKINGESLLGVPAQMQGMHMHGMLPPGGGYVGAAPQMVPAPMVYDTSYQDTAYDQSFFVGNAYTNMTYQNTQAPIAHAPYQHGDAAAQSYNYQLSLEADRKLFDDDSILLTEYLKLTQRPGNSKEIDSSMRNRVLDRCDTALRLMAKLQRPDGRFFYHVSGDASPTRSAAASSKRDEPRATATTTPLQHSTAVEFSFTSKCGQQQPTTALNRLMARLNVDVKTIQLPAGHEETPNQPITEEISVQTDPYECGDCVKRKLVTYVDMGTQCTPPETMEFSAQVTEDDFLHTARSALKSILSIQQSIASLTPAQILAQLSDNKELDTTQRGERERERERERDHEDNNYNRGPGASQYDRREFDRRNDMPWNARSYQQQQSSPQKNSNFPSNYSMNRPNFGNAPRPLMSLPRGGMRPPNPRMDQGGSGKGYQGYRPPYQNQNYGNMRRF